MRPSFRSILKRSFSLPSAIRFSSPRTAFSILATKRLRMAFSFLPPRRATQNVGLLSARYRDLLHFHFWPNLLKIIFQQLRLELLQLAPRCAHQILSPMLAHCPQVLFAHHSTIEDPNPSCFPVLALHRAQNGFQGGDIRPVPIEQFIAERKTLWIHDQSQHQLLAVR